MPAASKSLLASRRVRAQLIRRVSESTALSRTMRKTVRVLAEVGIPSLVVGGYAVQENGTQDLRRTWISWCGCSCGAGRSDGEWIPGESWVEDDGDGLDF